MSRRESYCMFLGVALLAAWPMFRDCATPTPAASAEPKLQPGEVREIIVGNANPIRPTTRTNAGPYAWLCKVWIGNALMEKPILAYSNEERKVDDATYKIHRFTSLSDDGKEVHAYWLVRQEERH